MADIFLSYSESDRPRAGRLADALQAAGFSVWWDRRIPAGSSWRALIEQQLQQMRCMVVCWSARSVLSDWVCEEAAEGRALRRLVPVLLERVRPPAGFREVQAADLVDWNGSADDAGFRQLLQDIQTLIGEPVGSASAQGDLRDSEAPAAAATRTGPEPFAAPAPPPMAAAAAPAQGGGELARSARLTSIAVAAGGTVAAAIAVAVLALQPAGRSQRDAGSPAASAPPAGDRAQPRADDDVAADATVAAPSSGQIAVTPVDAASAVVFRGAASRALPTASTLDPRCVEALLRQSIGEPQSTAPRGVMKDCKR